MTTQQLMRVYGALMWSLSRILGNPEVSRIYVGSFWNQPLQHSANRHGFIFILSFLDSEGAKNKKITP